MVGQPSGSNREVISGSIDFYIPDCPCPGFLLVTELAPCKFLTFTCLLIYFFPARNGQKIVVQLHLIPCTPYSIPVIANVLTNI